MMAAFGTDVTVSVYLEHTHADKQGTLHVSMPTTDMLAS